MEITKVIGREILDSRGNPTVEADVHLADGIIGRRASAVALITGSGLKDIRSAKSAVGEPFEIRPDGTALDDILREQGLTECRHELC